MGMEKPRRIWGCKARKSSRALLDPKSIWWEQEKAEAVEKAPTPHPAPDDLKRTTTDIAVRAMLRRPWPEAKTELGSNQVG